MKKFTKPQATIIRVEESIFTVKDKCTISNPCD